MKKVTTKILSFILTLSMVFSLPVPAFAVETDTVNSEPAYIEEGVYVPEEMTAEELNSYNKLINEQVDFIADEYEDVSCEWIRDNIKGALEGNSNVVTNTNRGPLRAGSIIPDINISNTIVAAAINVAIGMVVGGSLSGISAYVKKAGVREAKKVFSKTIATKLKAWGLKNFAKILPVAAQYVLNVIDPGTAIAKYIDKNDVKPNNGQVNFVL
jgi:hypothetical protein